MRVLHINTSSSQGGAAIAAYRHVEAMCRSGLNARLLAKTGVNRPYALVSGDRLGDRAWNYALFKMTERLKKPHYSFSFMSRNYGIKHIEAVRQADIIYLHWINNFLGFNDIDWLLTHKKRVVWFLHDMWPMTGGCHHALSCESFFDDCQGCEQLIKLKSLAFLQHEKKMKQWIEADNLVVAAPSLWLANKAKLSSLFKDKMIIVCPNVLDLDLFTQKDKTESRKELGLDCDKKYVLFGSAVGSKNVFKGMSCLYQALEMINQNYEIIIMGDVGDDYPKHLMSRTHLMGYVVDEQKKVSIYNASDVFVIPSLAENFPNMVIEAMACGVPVVGFKVGGIVEQISHKRNGYLAETNSPLSLAEGIEWVLASSYQSQQSRLCRDYVCNHCSYDIVLRNHSDLLNI